MRQDGRVQKLSVISLEFLRAFPIYSDLYQTSKAFITLADTMQSSGQTHEQRERSFGRYPGMSEVVDTLFVEREMGPRDILLGALNYFPKRDQVPLERDEVHWVIAWRVGAVDGFPLFRLLQVVTERIWAHDRQGRPMYRDVFTNWGPRTKTVTPSTDNHSLWVKIGSLNFLQRQQLEAIASNETVQEPNGIWNCQTWVKSVLQKAIQAGLLDAATVTHAINTLSVSWHSAYFRHRFHTHIFVLQSTAPLNAWLAARNSSA